MFRPRRIAFIKDYASIMNQGIEPRHGLSPRYKKRWKVERLFAWLHWFRRLVTRYEYPRWGV
jgi:transposase